MYYGETKVYSGSSLGFADNNSVMAKHKAFADGAEWRIDSVWHDASEMPEKKFALVEYGCFPKGHGYLVVPDPREVIESITRWAYIEDLRLNTEE